MTDIQETSSREADATGRYDIDRVGEGTVRSSKRGPFARLALFLRQIVAELRKVVRPTRGELLSYTVTVIVFVLVIMTLVASFDFGLGKLMFWVFGGGNANP